MRRSVWAEVLDTAAFVAAREAQLDWIRGPAENLREPCAARRDRVVEDGPAGPPVDRPARALLLALMSALQGRPSSPTTTRPLCGDVEQTEPGD